MPGGGMDALALLYFAKKLVTTVYVRTIGVCGYGYIYGYPWIYPSISTENLWIWIWIWMANFISKPEFIIPRLAVDIDPWIYPWILRWLTY